MTLLTGPSGQKTQYVYDVHGSLLQEVDLQTGQARTMTYNILGHTLTETDRNGLVRTYTYADLLRRETETWSGGGEEDVHRRGSPEK